MTFLSPFSLLMVGEKYGFTIPNSKSKRQKSRRNHKRRSSVPRSVGGPDYKISRTWTTNLNMNQSTGFAGGSFDLAMSFALGNPIVKSGGVIVASITTPGYTDFTALFDSYIIDSVDLEIFYSNNTSSETTPTICAPLFHYVNDYDDIISPTLTEILQYPSVQSKVMLEGGGSVLRHTLRPRPMGVVIANAGTFTGQTNNLTGPVWLDAASADIPHFGFKLFWNNFGRSTNSDIGTVMINCKTNFRFRQPR